ncbi:MAG: ribonuclease E/G, partial [Alphaproteobacteria bacterium]
MSTRMLIDARHQEETRVAIIRGNRVEEFDYESVTKKQIKGNIYLAKVTRVEPSLQAAFVDFGGNRHGFLPFSEIHPDYYQIPVADREALLREEREDARADAETDEAEGDARASAENAGNGEEVEVESIEGAEEDEEERRPRRRLRRGALRRRYKIQEVIKRRQILLVQVAKEERGSKGAALTTYLSLAGRYCVLMPNSPRGGGISRKIASPKERKKLKDVLQALDVPEGMGCIIRTAGLNRTKSEIKRDFDYLLRLWDDIRELTLNSIAPALIYEEGDLIKRSIRDLYTREVDEILVEGEEGYRTAKEFMSLLMPSHARKVKHYKDDIPLFHRYQVEQQLEAIHSPIVQLKSGGYLVINPTEALVAIDVNSGRATREHNIEETALQTNLEAAEEIARQLRLRDLAGLIVIDFIDMEDRSNVRAVEKRLKEALKSDRARLQVGRISSFGLLEMSRQRLRPNLVEASTITCPRCAGTGVVRSIQSGALAILRAIEEEGIRNRSEAITIKAPSDIAFYLLNEKRGALAELETRYDLRLTIDTHGELGAEPYLMERTARALPSADDAAKVEDHVVRPSEPTPAAVEETEAAGTAETGETEEDKPRRKRRRRPRRRRPAGEGEAGTTTFDEDSQEEGVKAEASKKNSEAGLEGEEPSGEAAVPDESAAPTRKRRTSRRRKSGT